MSLRRRWCAVVIGAAICLTVGVTQFVGATPRASAARSNTGTAGQPFASFGHPVLTPYLHPRPSGLKAFRGARRTASPWTALVNPPPFGTPGTMLLASDGSVLVHDEPDNNSSGGTEAWWRLSPDAHGSYVDGTWTKLASMPAGYNPLYFGSAILPDGRLIVEGGEYINNTPAWTNRGAIYDPVSNTWAPVTPPPGWTNIGDAASVVLPDGTFMLQHACNTCTTNPDLSVDDALLNPKTMTWTVIPATGKNDPNDEEGWTLEPSGQLLTIDAWAPGQTQLFDPASGTWTFAGALGALDTTVNPFPIVELGPQAEMPGGNVFAVGGGTSTQEYPNACTTDAETHNALYHYVPGTVGTWSPGPVIRPIDGEQYSATDGPASTLPDGDVLFDASACTYNLPTHFFVYHAASNSLTQIPDVPNAPNDTSYATRTLNLPNGQILFDDGSSQMEVYTEGGTPQPAWAPTVSSLSSSTLAPGGTYSLSGTQLAGLDTGSAYGDDVQDNTNYPLVRITNTATGVVTYARSFDWSSVSIAAGTPASTQFTLPAGTPAGPSTLVVVANGIPSAPQSVTVS